MFKGVKANNLLMEMVASLTLVVPILAVHLLEIKGLVMATLIAPMEGVQVTLAIVDDQIMEVEVIDPMEEAIVIHVAEEVDDNR
tara:strand:+ start:671 stop:922 length:252 start_codon:yes stop_codon:yes gene_type:complete